MGDLETYFSYRNSGINLVGLAVGTEDELRALGASAADASELAHLHHVYFGDTHFTGKQRKAREAAAGLHHDLATLGLIESFTAKLKKELDSWNLRVMLAGTPAHRIREVAGKLLKKLKPKKDPEPGVRITRRVKGPHSLTITDSSLNIATIAGVLESVNADDMLQATHDVFFKGDVGAKPAVHTQLIVTLDEFDKVINGEGDDIELQLTNGARMTGAEFLTYKFAEIGYATIVHPLLGPLNSYRQERFANFNQRITLKAVFPTCAHPNCTKPADYCQAHHLIPWQAGGYTNIDNLVFLCAYHNGINDDDPARPTGRGYMARLNPSTVGWIPPWGQPLTSLPAYQEAVARLAAEHAANPPGAG